MRTVHRTTGLPSMWAILLMAFLAACGSDNSNGQTVAINLSLIVDGRQAYHRSPALRFLAWIERWVPGATAALAQAVSDITTIEVQISGPGIAVPASTRIPVTDPSSGKEIPVSIQAPVGPNRTIRVSASNAATEKIFGGTLAGVNLTAGAPVDLVITLVRLFTVRVDKAGDGDGTVTSTPAGIDCGVTCEGGFEQGIPVSLTARPASGSVFVGWSGDCSSDGNCTLTGNASVTARFDLSATNHLHVDRAGTGTGRVTSNPNGISCGTSCDADFRIGSTVTLTAEPTEGSVFSNWSGGTCSGGATSCTVVMNTNQNVTAVFTAIVPLPMSTLVVEVSGSGTVTSLPSGISCPGSCNANFVSGDTVRLTAAPASGFTFVGWTGACSGTGDCQVAMNTNQTVSARFDQFVTLTVRKSGGGQGTVTDNTGAIFCGPGCESTSATFRQGTQVTLRAVADEGSRFDEWQGGPCNNQTGDCVLTMSMNRTAEANFDRDD